MPLSSEEVEKIAWLTRLEIRTDDINSYTSDISGILDLVRQLNTADTSGIAPLAHPLDQSQRLRQDQVTEQDQRNSFQTQAPQIDSGLYLVPKVIE